MRDRAPLFARQTSWLRCVPALLLALALAACGGEAPRTYPPLRYDYLTPLRLNVQSVTVEQRFIPGGSDSLNSQDPAPPVQTLTAMAQDRLQAVGTAGRAVFIIKDASLTRTPDGIDGSMVVELDVYGGGGTRAGFAEARVSRHRSGDDDSPSALYDMTKQLMDAMNVEFEYQVRRSLHDWLASANATPTPVQQQNLTPPGSTSPAPAAPPTALPGASYPSSVPPAAAPGAAPSSELTPPVATPGTPYPPQAPYPYQTPYPAPTPYAAPAYAAPATGSSLGEEATPTPLVPPQSP